MMQWSVGLCLVLFALGSTTGCEKKKPEKHKATGKKKKKKQEQKDEFVAGSEADAFSFALESDPESLDPTRISGAPGGRIAFNIFEGLLMPAKTTEDAKEPGDLVRPGVAESYEVSEDGKTYTFKLRSDAKWSNGDPLTAADFIYSWKRTLLPGYPADYAELFYDIKGVPEYNNEDTESNWENVGIKAPDKHTIKIELSHPTPYFPELIAFYTFFPQPKPVVKEHGNEWTKPDYIRTNGAYKLTEYVKGREIVLEKNENYWDADNVSIEKVRIPIIENTEKLVEAYKNEKLHWTGASLAPWQVPDFKDRPDYHKENTLGTYYVRINVSDGESFLSNPKLAQALRLAVDRQAIVDDKLNGVFDIADSFVPDGMTGYASQYKLEHDVEKAKKLLEEIGHPKGKDLREIEILHNKGKMHTRVVAALEEAWESKLGLKIKPVEKSWEDYLRDIDITNYDLARSGWVGDYADAMTFLEMWTSGNGNNDTGWSNDKYDEFITKAKEAKQSPERIKKLLEAEQLLLEKGPVIPIFHFAEHVLVGEKVQGYAMHNRNIHLLKDLSVE